MPAAGHNNTLGSGMRGHGSETLINPPVARASGHVVAGASAVGSPLVRGHKTSVGYPDFAASVYRVKKLFTNMYSRQIENIAPIIQEQRTERFMQGISKK